MAAGTYHFVNPRFFLKMMPSFLPLQFHKGIVYISGIFEIVFSLMLFSDQTRSLAAWLIIALLVAVFPANIQMTIDFWKKKKPFLWATVVRLPLQIVLIWWAFLYTK